MSKEKNPNLKNKVVFTHRRHVIGIPEKVFGAAFVLCVFTAFVFCTYLGWGIGVPASLLFVALIFMPMYLVHKDDPDAYLVWMKSLFSPFRLTASRIKPRRLVLLSWDGHRSITTSMIDKE